MTDQPERDTTLAVSARIDRFVRRLLPYVDAVQVLATWRDADGHTMTAEFGEGNVHARLNMAREFSSQLSVEEVEGDAD